MYSCLRICRLADIFRVDSYRFGLMLRRVHSNNDKFHWIFYPQKNENSRRSITIGKVECVASELTHKVRLSMKLFIAKADEEEEVKNFGRNR